MEKFILIAVPADTLSLERLAFRSVQELRLILPVNAPVFEATFAVHSDRILEFSNKREAYNFFVAHIEPSKIAIAEALFAEIWKRKRVHQGGPCE